MKLTVNEFHIFQKIIYKESGINLNASKLNLVESRLYPRLVYYKLTSFSSYLKIVTADFKEKVEMLNLITTNETYFFREHAHFEFLDTYTKNIKENQSIKIWSAASSIGAEAYTAAMILDTNLKKNQWKILASDINTNAIAQAKRGLYKESLIEKIPTNFKKRYCLKGRDEFEGKFIVDKKLSKNIDFQVHNLIVQNSLFGEFDIIFLRNILIYFDKKITQKVLDNVLLHLKVGGYLIISLTENLEGLDIKNLKKHTTSIYEKLDES